MINLLFENPIVFLMVAVAMVIALSIHEFAHAWAADKLGDPTPRIQDRLTLNPLSHLDPLGTAALLLFGFGWGRPVMFDPFNLENPKRDAALIAAAGPASNLIMAVGAALILKFLSADTSILAFMFQQTLLVFMNLNIVLAVFNLIPVHPLDGGKILIGLLPREYALEAEDILNRYGMIILLLLIFPFAGGSAISQIITPISSSIMRLLLSI